MYDQQLEQVLIKAGLIVEETASLQLTYTADAQGEIDIERFIEGQAACFKTFNNTEKLTKKKLVVTDWSLADIEYKLAVGQKRILFKLFKFLIEEQKFEVYLWDGKLNRIYSLVDFEVNKNMIQPAARQEILSACALQQISVDQVKILDFHAVREILSLIFPSDKNKIGKQIFLDWFVDFPEEKIIKIAKTLHNLEIKLKINVFYPKFISYLHILLSGVKLAALEINFYCLQFNQLLTLHSHSLQKINALVLTGNYLNTDFLNTIQEKLINLQSITINLQNEGKINFIVGSSVLLPSVGKLIKKIVLKGERTDSNAVKRIFSAATHLEKINTTENIQLTTITSRIKILEISFQKNDALALDRSFSSLINLEIAYSDINLDELSALLNKLPQLQTLAINSCNELNIGQLVLTHSLSYLRKLKIHRATIIIKTLQTFLKNLPHLEELVISECKNLEAGELVYVPLSRLKRLDLSGSEINLTTLQTFMENAPDLEELVISKCKNVAKGELVLNVPLSRLKRLNLTESGINLTTLQAFLENAPHLEELNISSCKNVAKGELVLNVPLSRLKLLYLSGSGINLTTLQTLLEKAPNLENLDLAYVDNLQEGQFELNAHLFYLKKLSVESSEIKPEMLQTLLEKSPNLKILNLVHFYDFDEIKAAFNAGLTKLVDLDASSSTINLENLQILLEKSPNLKGLNLSDVDNLQEGQFELDTHLFNLERLFVKRCCIKSAALQTLLVKAPNLKFLDLEEVDNLEKGQFEANFSLPFLESLIASESNLTMPGLRQLIENTTTLRKLDISNCLQLTGDLASALMPVAPFLHDFAGENLPGISNDSFVKTLLSLKRLQGYLVIDRILATEDLASIIENLPFVEKFDLPYLSAQQAKQLLSRLDVKLITFPKTIICELEPKICVELSTVTPAIYFMQTSRFIKKNNLDKTQLINTNTELTPTTFHITEYFLAKPSLSPEILRRIMIYYRLKVETKTDQPHQIQAIQPKFIKNLLQQYQNEFQDKPNFFLGKINLLLTSEWESLPSLTPTDKLLVVEIDQPNESILFCYDNTTHQYLVRSAKAKTLKVEFFFLIQADISSNLFLSNNHIPSASDIKPASQLHNFTLNDLVVYCRSFASMKLTLPDEAGKDVNAINTQRLKAIFSQRAGSCHHRSEAFKYAFDQLLKIRANVDGYKAAHIISSKCHAWVELINLQDEVIRIDLGGFPAELKITPFLPPPSQKKPVSLPSIPPAPTSVLFSNLLKPVQGDTLAAYCQFLSQSPAALAICPSAQEIENLIIVFLQYTSSHNLNFFYVDDLTTITSTSARVNNGKLEKQASPLINFLANAATNAILLINWSNAKPNHLAFNSLFDKNRSLLGCNVSNDLKIVVAIDSVTSARMSEDFFSRFQSVAEVPEQLSAASSVLPIVNQPTCPSGTLHSVPLYESVFWKKTLIGAFVPQGNSFTVQQGALLTALAQGAATPLELVNPPWHLREFRLFYAELINKRCFCFNGQQYQLPKNFSIATVRKEYALEQEDYTYEVEFAAHEVELQACNYVLNIAAYERFFIEYYCNAAQQLQQVPGWLANEENQSITLWISDTMPESLFAKLLDEAKRYHCHITFRVPPTVKLPASLSKRALSLQNPTPFTAIKMYQAEEVPPLNNVPDFILSESPVFLEQPKAFFFVSEDIDFTEAVLKKRYPNAACLFINQDTLYEDLFIKLRLVVTPNSAELPHFCNEQGIVWQALQKNQTVILKGHFSPQLLTKLYPLFLQYPALHVNTQKTALRGRLILLADTASADYFQGLKYEHSFTPKAVLQYLNLSVEEYEFLSKASQAVCDCALEKNQQWRFAQLSAIRSHLRALPTHNPLTVLYRLSHDAKYERAKQFFHEWKQQHAGEYPLVKQPAATAAALIQQRLLKIKQHLDVAPYVFVAGSSGIGKSTFIQQELAAYYHRQQQPCQVMTGTNSLLSWLTSAEYGLKILFLDEADLEAEGAWDLFETLFNHSPAVLLQGQYYELTTEHKLVFAGNTMQYSGRQQHTFFERYGHVVSFKQLPWFFIAEKMIQPLLAAALLAKVEEEAILKLLGQVYDYSLAPGRPLITPRNMQTIAQHILLRLKQQPADEKNSLAAAQLAIHQEMQHLLTPEEYSALQQAVNLPLLPPSSETSAAEAFFMQNNPESNFVLTASRRKLLAAIDESFQLRELAAASPAVARSLRRGLLLEGESGLGKSSLAIYYLQQKGFCSIDAMTDITAQPPKLYYLIAASAPDSMRQSLLRAFHAGAVAIIDELNVLLFLEPLLNALLSGVDTEGNPAQAPGFMLIATQNPITYTGRKALSPALKNRLQVLQVPDYPEEELKQILTASGLSPNQVNFLLNDYQLARQSSSTMIKALRPNPRRLFDVSRSLRQDEHKRSREENSNASKLEKGKTRLKL